MPAIGREQPKAHQVSKITDYFHHLATTLHTTSNTLRQLPSLLSTKHTVSRCTPLLKAGL